MTDNCVFCKIIAGEIPGKVVYQDELLVAVQDINPQAPHHILLLPRKHIPTTLDLTDADGPMLSRLFLAANQIARTLGVAEEGFRIVNNCNARGGQVVWHLHFHLLAGRDMSWPPG